MATIKINFIPNAIGPFQVFRAKKNSMTHGFYYDYATYLPFAQDKRHIRVWLPDSYDFYGEEKHPVLYMADGQNLVDKYLTKYGDWHLDRVVSTLRKEGYPEPILVGIDSPKDPVQRANELNPPYTVRRKIQKQKEAPLHPIGDQFIDYIVDTLKPMIDTLFHTDPRREATGIGGSSMGGIMAFYGWLAYPLTFGYSHCFSPPFFFYKHRDLRHIMKGFSPNPDTHGRIFLYVGGTDFEKIFTKDVFWMKEELERIGYGKGTMGFAHDAKATHHEEWWYRYSFPAMRFWLKGLR